MEGGSGSCGQPVETHEDCGYYGISKTECESRGCCFQLPYVAGPQCYHHSPREEVQITFRVTPNRCFKVVGIEGETLPSVCAGSSGLATVGAVDAPVYLTPQ